ncbi:hypothetical protein AGMMS49944_05400 [Spirochaetia bacterium]|nr:hypothetical protein AGMMS49944_05400 [Spirochaetia bacterium]
MKAIERRLRFFEDYISQNIKPRKSVAIIEIHTDFLNTKMDNFFKVRVMLDPAHGNYRFGSAPDYEAGRRILEKWTKDFINPVWVIFNETNEAIKEQERLWSNAGGKDIKDQPCGKIWSEYLYQGRWTKKENERK